MYDQVHSKKNNTHFLETKIILKCAAVNVLNVSNSSQHFPLTPKLVPTI